MSDGLLADSLAIAVPLKIAALRCMDRESRQALTATLRSGLREDSGDLLYGGSGCARSFATFARAIAALSFQPGGITVAGQRWCAAHRGLPWNGADGTVCPRCRHEESAALRAAPRRPGGLR